MSLKNRIEAASLRLGLNQQQAAALLGISPEWMSKIVRGHVAGSSDIGLRLNAVLRSRGIDPASIESSSTLAVAEEPAPYESGRVVKKFSSDILATAPLSKRPVNFIPGFEPRPPEPTPQACIDYFLTYLKAAEQAPGGVGVAWWKLQKNFPLDEFQPAQK